MVDTAGTTEPENVGLASMEDDELTFWRGVFEAHQQKSNGNIVQLLDPELPIQTQFEQMVSSYLDPQQRRVSVLDVGCGPLSVLGKRGSAFSFDITGVDPLATDYAHLLDEFALKSPHKAIKGVGEELDDLVGGRSFDFIHSRNALDHCGDPRAVIRSMVALAKPGSKIFINVNENEAENAAYSGFHRWNFTVQGEQILVWNPGSSEFLDSIVDRYPYSFTTRPTNDKRKFPLEYDIVIHKTDLSPVTMTQVSDNMRAKYSSKHGWVIFRSVGEVDPHLSLFIHGLKGEVIGCVKSFRWYDHIDVRTFAFPVGEFSAVRIGQYYRDYSKADAPYVNVWSAKLESVDE